MKVGDRIKVYQHWVTREKFEDVGILAQFIGQEAGMPGAERWWVTFDDDTRYFRTVWPQDVV